MPQNGSHTTKKCLVALLFIFDVVAVHANPSKSSTGLTIQLIPPISPDSPFYQSVHNNLYYSQPNQTYPRIPMSFRTHWYVTRVTLGVPRRTYTLLVDTASELTWIQCTPCFHCHSQPQPIFNPTHSTTYQSIRCPNWVCQPRFYQSPFHCADDNHCKFDIHYISGIQAMGHASQETFWFHDSHKSFLKPHEDFVFGCSSNNSGFKLGRFGISGVLGMNNGPTSITTQLSHTTKGRFSYCLRPISDSQNSLLKFGDDIVIPEDDPRQTLLIVDDSSTPQYQIRLYDIGFGPYRLSIPPSVFTLNLNGTGGCWLDTGFMGTHLPRVAYDMVKQAITIYYKAIGLTRIYSMPEGLEICYHYRPRFQKYVAMTYYFDDAEMPLTVESTYLFRKAHGYFCLPIVPSSGHTIIGVVNQQNTRFVFDCTKGLLQFVQANCVVDDMT